MQREEHLLGELHAYRYRADNPKYALVVSHGIGGHGGIYDVFCTHHAGKASTSGPTLHPVMANRRRRARAVNGR